MVLPWTVPLPMVLRCIRCLEGFPDRRNGRPNKEPFRLTKCRRNEKSAKRKEGSWPRRIKQQAGSPHPMILWCWGICWPEKGRPNNGPCRLTGCCRINKLWKRKQQDCPGRNHQQTGSPVPMILPCWGFC